MKQMKQMKQIAFCLFLSIVTIAKANAQNIDVTYVKHATGDFLQTNADTWVESGERNFKEISLDKWSVYLQANDLQNNGWAKIQLDLYQKNIKYSDYRNTTKRVLYNIASSNNSPLKVSAAPGSPQCPASKTSDRFCNGCEGPGFEILNATDYPIYVALKNFGPLYWGKVEPGKVWSRDTGSWLFDIEVRQDVNGQIKNYDTWDAVWPVALVAASTLFDVATGGVGAVLEGSFAEASVMGAAEVGAEVGVKEIGWWTFKSVGKSVLKTATKNFLKNEAHSFITEIQNKKYTYSGYVDLCRSTNRTPMDEWEYHSLMSFFADTASLFTAKNMKNSVQARTSGLVNPFGTNAYRQKYVITGGAKGICFDGSERVLRASTPLLITNGGTANNGAVQY